jgi:hypothetical protein
MYNFNNELSAQQRAQLQTVAEKYAAIEGNYEGTMLAGIWHGFCDSGILTDCFSVEDAELVEKYFTEEAQCDTSIFDMNAFIKTVEGKDLQCVQAITEIEAICEDAELGAAYIATLL